MTKFVLSYEDEASDFSPNMNRHAWHMWNFYSFGNVQVQFKIWSEVKFSASPFNTFSLTYVNLMVYNLIELDTVEHGLFGHGLFGNTDYPVWKFGPLGNPIMLKSFVSNQHQLSGWQMKKTTHFLPLFCLKFTLYHR